MNKKQVNACLKTKIGFNDDKDIEEYKENYEDW